LSALSDEKRRLIEHRLQARRDAGRPSVIPARDPAAPAVMSELQRGLFFLDQTSSGLSSYNVAQAFVLRGDLDVRALHRALDDLVNRHDALRTRFNSAGVGGVEILPSGASDFAVVDPVPDLNEFIRAEVRHNLDLGSGRLLRVRLGVLAPREHVLVMVTHHIASDAVSKRVLNEELVALYAAHHDGASATLADPALQYSDYAAWQVASATVADDVLWWRDRLAGAPDETEMPVDRPRRHASWDGAKHTHRFGAQLSADIADFSRNNRATTFMTLLAAFAGLLERYSGQGDVVIGSPTTGRHRPELERVVGLFLNTLPLRIDTSGNPTFRELVARTRATATEAYRHQDVPFDRIVRDLRPPRTPGRNPIFQATLTVKDGDAGSIAFDGLDVEPVNYEGGWSKFDLALVAYPSADGLSMLWQYATALFDAPTIERLARQLGQVLRAGINAPDVPLASLPLATQADLATIEGFNDTEVDYPSGCLHDLISAQSVRTPDAEAVGDDTGWITYRELDERANRLARHLASLGVLADARVAICLDRCINLEVAVLAVLKAGGAYVPLDPAYPRDRLAYMLEDCGAIALITSSGLVKELPSHDRTVLVDRLESLDHLPSTAPDSGVAPNNLAYIIYTSGTTGRPKGVEIEHRSVVNQLEWMQRAFGLNASDTVLQKTPLSFDASVWEILWTLTQGARLFMARPGGHLDPRYLIEVIKEHSVTVAYFVPSMLAAFVSAEDVRQCVSLRFIPAGGEAMPDDVKDACLRVLPNAALHNLYGPTEAAIAVTDEQCVSGVPVTIGRPTANTRALIVDSAWNHQPVGVPGELCLAGVQVARGYLGRPELTAEKFVNIDGERAYLTGDRAAWCPDGRIRLLGRLDDQVKLRGFRIELGEIESVLSSHPAVAQSCAVLASAPSGDPTLVAYVALRNDAQGAGSGSGDQLDDWKSFWEQTYQGSVPDNPQFDIRGWTSALTGDPIPASEMVEWVETTVTRIAGLGGDSILEIGAGSGLLMSRLAPDTSRFVATDYAASAVELLQAHVDDAQLRGAEVRHVAAGNLDANIVGTGFDIVVANSVVHYFPNADYLAEVLDRCGRVLAPNGRIFIGDVRDLRRQESFALSCEIAHRPSNSADDMQLRVADRCARDTQLLLDPGYFATLPGVSHVQVLPRRGHSHSEMNCFRYDVILHTGRVDAAELSAWTEWSAVGGHQDLADLLAVGLAEVGVRSIPDARLTSRPEGTPGFEAEAESVEVESLYDLADKYGYHLELSAMANAFCFDAAFTQNDIPVRFPVPPKGFAATYNDPIAARNRVTVRDSTTSGLAALLRRRLPEYMVPSAVVVLDTMPLSPAGKLDRRMLATRTLPAPAAAYVAPGTPTEARLALLWQEALGLGDPVSVADNFFDLGGHSLLALTLFPRIEREFRVKLALSMLFDNVTVASQAAAIESERTRRTAWSSLVVMREGGAKLPLFVLPELRGDVLTYRQMLTGFDPERPVYGIECMGLDGRVAPRTTIEGIARDCVRAIRKARPHGPYLLAGYCFGGVVAYEVASQLASAGEEVPFVGLVDATPYGRGRARGSTATKRPTLIERFTVRGRSEWHRKVTFVREVTRYRVNLAVSALCGALHLRTPRLFVDVRAANMRASRSYVAPDSQVKVTLFRASAGSTVDDQLRRQRWHEVAKGGVEMHLLVGENMGHYDIVKAAHAVQLAQAMNGYLLDLP
jgi:amino acid adenylation domain-containing protein